MADTPVTRPPRPSTPRNPLEMRRASPLGSRRDRFTSRRHSSPSRRRRRNQTATKGCLASVVLPSSPRIQRHSSVSWNDGTDPHASNGLDQVTQLSMIRKLVLYSFVFLWAGCGSAWPASRPLEFAAACPRRVTWRADDPHRPTHPRPGAPPHRDVRIQRAARAGPYPVDGCRAVHLRHPGPQPP